jgi:hypothetical protein
MSGDDGSDPVVYFKQPIPPCRVAVQRPDGRIILVSNVSGTFWLFWRAYVPTVSCSSSNRCSSKLPCSTCREAAGKVSKCGSEFYSISNILNLLPWLFLQNQAASGGYYRLRQVPVHIFTSSGEQATPHTVLGVISCLRFPTGPPNRYKTALVIVLGLVCRISQVKRHGKPSNSGAQQQ